ncbi:MAG: hypothetical protein KAH32_07250 [Chlamydiia bacterium]|nr:hypothetical protein [Chlamydiia bacterium]
MASIETLLKEMNKQYEDNVVSEGAIMLDSDRAPTGILPLDLCLGGGFPLGRISIIWGAESSLKTTIALKTIEMFQKMHPDKKCVFVDLEASYVPEWGAVLGVDNEKLIYVLPQYAEQAVDIIEGFLYADDVGIIVVDSLAALITANELDSSADKAVVGGSGLVIGKLYRKSAMALSTGIREGRTPTLLCINQVRQKIGGYGNPDVMPGGNAFKFASAMTIRVYGKDELDKKIHGSLPCWKAISGTINKWKVPVTAKTFEFKVSLMDDTGFPVGTTNDWNTLSTYLKDLGYLVKGEKTGQWFLFDEEYKTLNPIKKRLAEDLEFDLLVRNTVIDAVLNGIEEDETIDKETGEIL